MTSPNDAPLSERLEAVLALLGKSTPGELFILWLRNGSVKYPVATTKDRNIFIEPTSQQKAEDCRAIIAAVNLLRQHGPALAELARRVEGAQVGIVETMDDRKGYQANAVECDHLELGQRVRIVAEE